MDKIIVSILFGLIYGIFFYCKILKLNLRCLSVFDIKWYYTIVYGIILNYYLFYNINDTIINMNPMYLILLILFL